MVITSNRQKDKQKKEVQLIKEVLGDISSAAEGVDTSDTFPGFIDTHFYILFATSESPRG